MSQPISKDWMDERDRFGPTYLKGVDEFVKFACANNVRNLTTCLCPCKPCLNKRRIEFTSLKNHLITYGIDPKYRVWIFHGEKRYRNPVVHLENENVEEVNNENIGVGMENFVDDCYGLHEGVTDDAYGLNHDQPLDLDEPHIQPDLPKRYIEYKKMAAKRLYPSCERGDTTLSVIVELHNMKKQYGWSGAGVTTLLSKLKKWLLKGNTLPNRYPIMKEMLKDLGMKAERIDARENNCMLYRKEYENATECHHCNAPRYKIKPGKPGKRDIKEPNKVLRHFPLIPRLKRLYTIPWIANEMTWHHRATSSTTYMRHPIDSMQWQTTKSKWPDFSKDDRNVWPAIATDGFNPRGIQSTSYSCWPVITVIYNLPPSLCMKQEFQMMSLLIPGPKAPGQNIDIFLAPMHDEMHKLWSVGELAFDMHKMEHFMMKALFMWGIHDFPAFGNLSGNITHGYKACPIYNPFRYGNGYGFVTLESRLPPLRVNGPRLLEMLNHVNYVPGKVTKGRKRARGDVRYGDDNDIVEGAEITRSWYRKSILFDLEYWSHHKVRHVIDVMHVEKNVAEHIINMLLASKFKTKNSVHAREDMKVMGILEDQWMRVNPKTWGPLRPPAPYALDKEEKSLFLQTLRYEAPFWLFI